MTLYYSASTSGFYDSDIHGKSIPQDAVEISSEQHRALLEANAKGASIIPDANGHPQALFPPEPSESEKTAQKAESIRAERNLKLKKTDWTQLNDIPPNALHVTRDRWAEYRQSLRNLPQQQGFPDAIKWPQAPDDTENIDANSSDQKA